jgi:CRP-like cAMP-binding protein
LALVTAGRPATNYRSKQTIFRQGDPADAVYYIQSGNVQLSVLSERGKEGVIAMLEAGDFFGEGCLAGQL